MRRLLPRLARRAGIERRVRARGRRHSMAGQLREEGEDIGPMARQLGHQSITTAARDVDHLNPTAVLGAMWVRAR